MFVLDSVACADTFPADGASGGAQIVARAGSNGGYAAVTGADVMVQLGFMPDGATLQWTPPVHVAPGNIILDKGTRGIRFRNYVAGQIATVSAGLSEPSEPALQLTSAGVATPATTTVITGRVSSAGAVVQGTGYSVVRTGVGQYTVSFTAPFAAAPYFAMLADGSGGIAWGYFTTLSATQCILQIRNDVGALQDAGFAFVAGDIA